MNKLKYTFIVALATVLLTGCVREDIEPCPPLSIMIGVKDKNYSNIDEVEKNTGLDHRVDENLSFRSYIQKLYYSLTNIKTNEVVFTQHLHEVQGDNQLATAYVPEDLPFGTYVITIWGNIDNEAPVQDNGRYYTMHTNEVEGYDVYMTNDTLTYDYENANYTVELKRVKGKLIVQGVDLPPEISWSRKEITHLSTYAGRNGLYAGSGDVVNVTTWGKEPEIVTNTVLAPTAGGEHSTVNFNLYDNEAMTDPRMSTGNIGINIDRNRIEVVKLKYDEGADKLNVYLLVNAGWEQVHELDIEK